MSFGLSRGRTLDVGDVGIDLDDLPSHDEGRLDPRAWFEEESRPLEVEIGSGKGTFLVQEAAKCSETNFLGIERAAEFYRYGADRLRRHALDNVHMLHADAVDFMRYWCADAVVSVIHLYFSDPWPKKRHHKRRVIQSRTLMEFHRVLQEGGEVRIVTDHDELWAWCQEHAAEHESIFARRPFAGGDDELVGTNFERKYSQEGRAFHAMTLTRIDA